MALLTALQQYQDRASKQRKGKFGSHHTADEMHYSLASLEVSADCPAAVVWNGWSQPCL